MRLNVFMKLRLVHIAQTLDVVPLGPHLSLLFLNCSELSPVVSLTPKYPSTSSTVFVWALSIPAREEYIFKMCELLWNWASTIKLNFCHHLLNLMYVVTISSMTYFLMWKTQVWDRWLSHLSHLYAMEVNGDWVLLSNIFYKFGPTWGLNNDKNYYPFHFQELEGTFNSHTKKNSILT